MTPDELDRQVQHAVLMCVLASDPAQLSDDEVLLAVASDAEDFAERDGVLRALRDLNSCGLLHHRNGFAQATRAATRASELLHI